ncbi:Uma2 family endonuclease [Kibdelosporangium aridum]|uniref:Uma2 family endonuclease n=1 Tax=Kibdelosporangium aridum TaxID=2030 RepID=UPI001F40009B|nr:Uma2 family endonuclease [Kibdelosporangium aridum]
MSATKHLLTDLDKHLYTVGDYAALGETEYWSELQEGKIVVSPSLTYDHGMAVSELFVQVRAQLPPNLITVPGIDIDLALVPEDQPGTVRRPDLVVVERADRKRAMAEGRLLRASEVLLIVETVSPGSRRTDYRIKRDEYADAGIPTIGSSIWMSQSRCWHAISPRNSATSTTAKPPASSPRTSQCRSPST